MHNSFYSDDYYDEHDALCHFGVKGMHWGVRRTPEQLGHRKALTAQQFHAKTKRALTLKQLPTMSKGDHPIGYTAESYNQIGKIQDRSDSLRSIGPNARKTVALTSGIVAGQAAYMAAGSAVMADPLFAGAAASVALPSATIASIVGLHERHQLKKRGLNLDDDARQVWYDAAHPYEKLTELKRLPAGETAGKAIGAVNPRDSYELASESLSRRNNCANCTMATIMRMKGYDVQARPNPDGVIPVHTANVFGQKAPTFVSTRQRVGESTADYVQRGYDRLHDELSKQPKGAFGYVGLNWLKGGGHAINYVIGDTGPEFYDGQVKLGPPYTKSYFAVANPESYKYVRCDNVKPNPIVTHYVTSRNGGSKK